MANVGSAAAGKTLIGNGNGASPTYASIGTNSGLTNHGVLIAKGNSAFSATATGSAGQVLQSGGASADPVFSTATYPSTAGTSGNILTSNGTNWSSAAPAIVNTSRPAFIAIPSGTLTDVTGDGTAYTIVWGSQVANYGSNLNTGTGVFTAPNTGFYQFNCSFQVLNLSAGHTTLYANFTTTTAVYFFGAVNPFVAADVAAGSYIVHGSITTYMTAGNTCLVSLSVSGSTKTVDITVNSQFSGFLVC